ncbi:SusC/RagA family TonB-linked outer membrane protein [Flectobacillus major]|uniref:SusC/RagA family TonB-linked outer membrane protein n=1 Tax=Flectobacillus major TaxID=103 RepID=UPI0009DBA8A6|nr:SusC/RagA family TonB-linked outer membrane protein [Flectobacillus major]
MKKKHNLQRLLLRIMKVTLIQICMVVLFTSFVFARDSHAQEVLNQQISLTIENRDIKTILTQVEKLTDVKFMYSAEVIQAKRKVSFSARNEKLSEVLDRLLLPLKISYEVSKKRILLSSNEVSESPKNEDPADNTIENTPILTEVTGTVTNSKGETIPGVSIREEGTGNGVVSDASGKYTIAVKNEKSVLIFTSVGYKPFQAAVGSQKVFNIVLEDDNTQLNEVVVIGYGTVERKELTSSVAKIDAKNFNRGNVNNPAQLLQGKVAGLSIVRPGGNPNEDFSIRLRGLSTFGANSQPLIVIDGVIGGSLNALDPNDIKSIEVLKDASAAAIYGTRGSSGVIIVTTKRGTTDGKASIEYNTYVSSEEVARFVQNSTPEQFVEAGGQDLGFKTNWLDLVTRKGISNVHNLSFSNSSGSTSYTGSINYRNVEGIYIGTGFKQINARLNLTQRAINDRLTLSFNVGVTNRAASYGFTDGLRFAIIANPTAPVYINNDPAQGYLEPNSPEFHNPVAIAKEATSDGKIKTLVGSIRADFEVLDGWNVGAFYSNQIDNNMASTYLSSKIRYGTASGRGGLATKFSQDGNNELFEMTTSYKKTFNDLKINLVGGYSRQTLSFENVSAANGNFITDDLSYNNLGLGLDIANKLASVGSAKEESRLVAFFGRAMLNFKDSYFLSAALRHEGSSKFGPNHRWGNFYSVSGGADLLKALKISALTTLKLRAGYGVTGALPNQNYEYLQRLGTGPRFLFEGNFVPSVAVASNPNPDLKWEQKAETNIGLDFGLIDNRLTGSVDYYVRNTKDVLQTVSVSVPPNFFGTSLLNIGKLKSNGLEVGLNYAVMPKEIKGLVYNTGLVYSTYNTQLVSFDGKQSEIYLANLGPPGLNGTLVVRLKEGEKIGDIMAPIFEGVDDKGARIIKDQNGDGQITRADYVVVGNGLPKFELAWNNSLEYKNFDLNFLIRGAFGHSLVNINRAYYESPAASNNYNPVRTKYYLPNLKQGESWNSYYVEKADFVKLDNITLGYNVNLSKKSAFKKIRFYASGQNLFVISGYTGVDPEVHYNEGGTTGSPLAPGIDQRTSYFRTKTFTFGINIGF